MDNEATTREHRQTVAATLAVAYESGRAMGNSYVPNVDKVFDTFLRFLDKIDEFEEEQDHMRQLYLAEAVQA